LPQGIARLVAESRIGKHAVAEMSQATARLLQAAAGIVGGEAALAKELNIGETLMRAYIQQRRPLPDFLLLRTVDLVLDHTGKPLADPAVRQALGDAHYPELKSDSS